MKAIKLSVATMAILGTTAAMAAQPAYEYNPEQGIIHNTTGAVVGSTKTLVDTAIHPAAVSAEIGTSGYGANIAWGVNESTELQAGWSGMKLDGNVDLDTSDSIINWKKVLGDDYEDFKGNFAYNVKASNPYLGVQVRPFKNWLTVGTGVMVPRNNIDLTLVANSIDTPITVKGVKYNVKKDGRVDIKAENKNALAPYATLGFRPNIDNRWGMFAEVGAAYMGDFKTDVNVKGNIEIEDPQVAATVNDVVAKFEKDAEEKLKNNHLKWYPIAKLGLTYRF